MEMMILMKVLLSLHHRVQILCAHYRPSKAVNHKTDLSSLIVRRLVPGFRSMGMKIAMEPRPKIYRFGAAACAADAQPGWNEGAISIDMTLPAMKFK